jgi:thiosulfate reductase cytochrome b subunit
VIFVVLPLIVLAGLGMSPRLDTVVEGWVDLLGGRQSARTLHFAAAFLLLAFVVVHVFEVIVTGLWNNLRSMITGYYRLPGDEHERAREEKRRAP